MLFIWNFLCTMCCLVTIRTALLTDEGLEYLFNFSLLFLCFHRNQSQVTRHSRLLPVYKSSKVGINTFIHLLLFWVKRTQWQYELWNKGVLTWGQETKKNSNKQTIEVNANEHWTSLWLRLSKAMRDLIKLDSVSMTGITAKLNNNSVSVIHT